MIREYLASLGASVASPAARRLGAVSELAALKIRHSRCARAWAPHLEQTRAAILSAAQTHAGPDRSALLVGAGLVFDIPLAEFACLFRRIYLADLAFLRHTRHIARRFKGVVELLPVDISGAYETVARARATEDLQEVPGVPADVAAELDWVVSINCLTQLPLLPAQWLLRRGLPEDVVEGFGQSLIRGHLDWLASLEKPWCLVTELQDTRFDRHGQTVGGTDYGPLVAPWLESQSARHIADWPWEVHPAGELPAGETEVRRVFAWQSA